MCIDWDYFHHTTMEQPCSLKINIMMVLKLSLHVLVPYNLRTEMIFNVPADSLAYNATTLSAGPLRTTFVYDHYRQ